MTLGNIFREYDIRGLVGKELTPKVYERIGSAFAEYVRQRSRGKPSCVVGRDNRPSSLAYANAFIEGFRSEGGDVIDVGLATTPSLYFANKFFHATAAAAITASHNPPEYNGVKFVYKGESAGGIEVQKIKKSFFATKEKKQKGTLTKENLFEPYLRALSAGAHVKHLTVVVDCGNGVASLFAVPLLRRLGCRVFALHCDASRPFTTHLPDPVDPKNYEDLKRVVKKNKADLGLVFDGDGDRLGAVDENGEIVWPDKLLILFARDYLKKKQTGKVVVEIKCSQAVYDDVLAHGGKPVLSPTGRTRVEQLMKQEHAELAGEMSGHFFFGREWLSDAFFATRRLLEIVSRDGAFSQLLQDVPKYYSSQEYRVDVKEEEKFNLVQSLASEFKKNHEVVTLDGAKVLFSDGWGLARASQNEPKLSLRFEGKTPQALKRIQGIFKQKLEEKGVKTPF